MDPITTAGVTAAIGVGGKIIEEIIKNKSKRVKKCEEQKEFAKKKTAKHKHNTEQNAEQEQNQQELAEQKNSPLDQKYVVINIQNLYIGNDAKGVVKETVEKILENQTRQPLKQIAAHNNAAQIDVDYEVVEEETAEKRA